MKPVELLIVGAGGRGRGFAGFALKDPGRARVVGVAEPDARRRQWMVEHHRIPSERAFADWREAAARPRLADAVVIATQDRDHADPAVAFAELRYHMLLEKPMAVTEADCRRVVQAVTRAPSGRADIIFAVCHVMRYTAYTRRLKELLDAGAIGQLISVQHLENVGFWHMAHSYVRGNWRREEISSPMLLSKSCHDLDWIRHIVGRRCLSVSSFGSLVHFRPENRPSGAVRLSSPKPADRCLDCAVEPDCPYSAKRIYLGRLERGDRGWPVDVLAEEVTPESITAALRDGPYGRCVYACDNDVVDNQVVNMLFEGFGEPGRAGGATASFSMVGLSEMAGRKTRLFGTRGQIQGDGRTIEVFDFLTEQRRAIDTRVQDGSILGGHGGGDGTLMDRFLLAVATGDRALILSGPQETLESHLMVFAAERSRRENRVVELEEDAGPRGRARTHSR